MDLLLDIFGFASVLLSGVARTAQCLTLGCIAFLALVAVPLGHRTGGRAWLAPVPSSSLACSPGPVDQRSRCCWAMQVAILSGHRGDYARRKRSAATMPSPRCVRIVGAVADAHRASMAGARACTCCWRWALSTSGRASPPATPRRRSRGSRACLLGGHGAASRRRRGLDRRAAVFLSAMRRLPAGRA